MGRGVCYTIGESKKAIRDYWRGWDILTLALLRRMEDGRFIFRVEADCNLKVPCDHCGGICCIGCGQQVSIDITGGEERVTCLRCWRE